MTAAQRLEFLVEEPSMEAFLRGLLPPLLPEGCAFEIRVFRGKHDLIRQLEDWLGRCVSESVHAPKSHPCARPR